MSGFVVKISASLGACGERESVCVVGGGDMRNGQGQWIHSNACQDKHTHLAKCALALLVERSQPDGADMARPVVALCEGIELDGLGADEANLAIGSLVLRRRLCGVAVFAAAAS